MLSPDNPATPWLLGAALAAMLAVFAYVAVRRNKRDYARFKKLRSTRRRQQVLGAWVVQSFAVFGAAASIGLLLAWQFVPLVLAAVNAWPIVRDARAAYAAGGTLTIVITGAAVALLLAWTVLGPYLARPRPGDETPPEIPSLGDVQALLPRNRQELRYGVALSLNAGLVEELFFRLTLPAMLYGMLYGLTRDAAAAVIGSLLIFGLLHLYQGAWGIVVSLLVGAVLLAIYVATGSILLAIVVHALFDLRSLVLIPVIVLGVHRVPGVRRAGAARAAPKKA